MVKLVCKENPSIFIVAPDELVSEVGGNCWQVGGPQPITYPKHLWEKMDMDYVSLPSNIDEASEKYADTQNKNFLNPEIVKNIFKSGAKWMAGQGQTFEAHFDDGYGCAVASGVKLPFILWNTYEDGDVLKVQIRKKQ